MGGGDSSRAKHAAGGSAEALTLEDGEVRKPVTGEARTGEANAGATVPTTSVNEADSVSGCDVAEGGAPSETARRTRQARPVAKQRADGFDVVGTAVKLPRDDRHHRHVDWRLPPPASSPERGEHCGDGRQRREHEGCHRQR